MLQEIKQILKDYFWKEIKNFWKFRESKLWKIKNCKIKLGKYKKSWKDNCFKL